MAGPGTAPPDGFAAGAAAGVLPFATGVGDSPFLPELPLLAQFSLRHAL